METSLFIASIGAHASSAENWRVLSLTGPFASLKPATSGILGCEFAYDLMRRETSVRTPGTPFCSQSLISSGPLASAQQKSKTHATWTIISSSASSTPSPALIAASRSIGDVLFLLLSLVINLRKKDSILITFWSLSLSLSLSLYLVSKGKEGVGFLGDGGGTAGDDFIAVGGTTSNKSRHFISEKKHGGKRAIIRENCLPLLQ